MPAINMSKYSSYCYTEKFGNCLAVICGYKEKRLTIFAKKLNANGTRDILYQADSTFIWKLRARIKKYKKQPMHKNYHNLDKNINTN